MPVEPFAERAYLVAAIGKRATVGRSQCIGTTITMSAGADFYYN